MRHSEIRRACHDAGYAAFLAIADNDERRTQRSIEDFDGQVGSFSVLLYDYSRERSFPKPEVLWRKAHEFYGTPVDRDWTKIAESERVYFTVFGATAAALEPIHEEDPEGEDASNDGALDQEEQGMVPGQATEGEAEAPSEEPGAAGPGEVDQGGQAPEPDAGTEGDPANAGDVTEPPVDHSTASAEADADSLVVPPVDHSAATPEAEAAEAEAEGETPIDGANIHGIGPDTDGGANPDYQPEEQPAPEASEEQAAEADGAEQEEAAPSEATTAKSRRKK